MKRNLIYDVGMNNGDDTAYDLYKGFQVVAIEANPQLVKRAKKRFKKEIKSGALIILNLGVAEEERELPFWVCETHPEWSSFDRGIASRDNCPHHQIIISCRRFRSILQEFGTPYYLKVDIEGNDRLCLQDLEPDALPKYLSVEALGTELLDLMANLGYTRFKCISQFHYMPLQIPPCSEQRSLDLCRGVEPFRRIDGWTFPFGSSGPFGKELLGRWMRYNEMCDTYQTFLRLKREGKSTIFWGEEEYSFWADFHATQEE